jgi:type II secretory pathway component HofQ
MAPTATGRGALGGAWVPADVASDHWGAGYGAALGAAAPGTVVINVETGKPTIVTLDARSAPVDEVLRQISSKTGTEITLRQKADTAITIHVTDTPTNVVKAVSLAAGLALEERGDTLVVGTEANK